MFTLCSKVADSSDKGCGKEPAGNYYHLRPFTPTRLSAIQSRPTLEGHNWFIPNPFIVAANGRIVVKFHRPLYRFLSITLLMYNSEGSGRRLKKKAGNVWTNKVINNRFHDGDWFQLISFHSGPLQIRIAFVPWIDGLWFFHISPLVNYNTIKVCVKLLKVALGSDHARCQNHIVRCTRQGFQIRRDSRTGTNLCLRRSSSVCPG